MPSVAYHSLSIVFASACIHHQDSDIDIRLEIHHLGNKIQ